MEKVVLDLGGSIIAPAEFNIEFLRRLRGLLANYIKFKKFFIVIGGGAVCRKYIASARQLGVVSKKNLDELGISATRLNAEFFRVLMGNAAEPEIFLSPVNIQASSKRIIVGGGWKPGFSTDYVSLRLAIEQNIKTVVVLTNVDYVYDKDPNKFANAKKILRMSWTEMRKLIGDKWVPGAKLPLDPLACKIGEQAKLRVVFMNGKKLSNFEKFLRSEKFVGTIIG